MITIHSILPQIERDVKMRVESTTLTSMSASDLRELVYRLIEREQNRSSDPAVLFSSMVDAAEDMHTNYTDAMDRSAVIRASLLRTLLHILEPAIPLLIGPIVVETTKKNDAHESREHHPILHGIELINGEKECSVSPDTIVRSGVSWWMIAIPPDGEEDPVSCRYAMLHHDGRRKGYESMMMNRLELVSSSHAARKIRDGEFEGIIKRIHRRLLSLQSPKSAERTAQIRNAAEMLEAGLRGMREHGVAHDDE